MASGGKTTGGGAKEQSPQAQGGNLAGNADAGMPPVSPTGDDELLELQRVMMTQGPAHLPGVMDPGDAENGVIRFEMRRALQREAYGQFVADGPIRIAGVLAFTRDHPVPVEHVERYDLERLGLVRRVADARTARGSIPAGISHADLDKAAASMAGGDADKSEK